MVSQSFHYTYQAARHRFLSLAKSDAREMVSHVHPLQGPDGEIAMDIASFGSASAAKVLVLSSGTHGIEGYCGSFVQCELLAQGVASQLPEDLGLVLIHGVNPYGFAWQRRVNEDNIDLNRNFIDHGVHPKNPGYEELAAILEPSEWNDAAASQMWQQIFQIAKNHHQQAGWQAAAMTSGQYTHPNGVFYGGQEPAWSNQKVRQFAESLKGREVFWLDIHTALGPYGEAECIVEYASGTKPLERAEALWGSRVKNTKTNESASADVAGSIGTGAHQILGDDLVFAGLEYGTVKSKQVLQAIIADQWLHRYGDLSSEQGKGLKQEMMDAFYPDDPVWRASVFKIAEEVIEAVRRA